MSQSSEPQLLTPEEVKEIQTYFEEKNIDIQIHFEAQKIRRMEDGGIVIDPPVFTTQIVRKPQPDKNHKIDKLDTA